MVVLIHWVPLGRSPHGHHLAQLLQVVDLLDPAGIDGLQGGQAVEALLLGLVLEVLLLAGHLLISQLHQVGIDGLLVFNLQVQEAAFEFIGQIVQNEAAQVPSAEVRVILVKLVY